MLLDLVKKIDCNVPKGFYNFRENIDCNDIRLNNYSPFLFYLNAMVDNIALEKYHKKESPFKDELAYNIEKLNIADSIIKNEKIKNNILNNIAFIFSIRLKNKNIINNNEFLERYYQLVTDDNQKNEIKKINNAVQTLKINNSLPKVNLINGNIENANPKKILLNKKTVIFFWTSKAKSHLEAPHRKIKTLKVKYPNVQFIAINVNDSVKDWKETLNKYQFDGVIELRATDFKDIKDKWVITKIQRFMVINSNTTIKQPSRNLFDVKFEDDLK